MVNTVEFSSFFQQPAIDNNGQACIDINAGLDSLYKQLSEFEFSAIEYIRIPEWIEHYPDLLALKSNLGKDNLWWWILFSNGVEDPLTAIKENWTFGIINEQQINTFVETTNNNQANGTDARVGSVIELN